MCYLDGDCGDRYPTLAPCVHASVDDTEKLKEKIEALEQKLMGSQPDLAVDPRESIGHNPLP